MYSKQRGLPFFDCRVLLSTLFFLEQFRADLGAHLDFLVNSIKLCAC